MKIYIYQIAHFKYFFKVILAILISSLTISTSSTANETEFANSQKNPTIAEVSAANNRADRLWQQGELTRAIALWKRSASIYRERGLVEREIALTLKIASGYTSLGQLELAEFHLLETLSRIEGQTEVEARVRAKLGDIAQKKGELDEAIAYYKESLAVDRELSTINNLAIALERSKFRSQLKASSARNEEKQRYSIEAENSEKERINLLKQANLLLSEDKPASSLRTIIELAQIESLSLKQLVRGRKLNPKIADSRNQIFLILNWAELDSEQRDRWLELARKEAQNDEATLAYVYLEKGSTSFQSQDYKKARANLSKAIALATKTNNYEVLYRAFWLRASIEKKIGSNEVAMDYYRKAIALLSDYFDLRSNFNEEQRLDFANEIEPLYREALALLLKEAEPEETDLVEAIAISQKLRKAQLQQFFGDNCNFLQAEEVTPEYLAPENAILLTSIIEDEATHLILQLPDKEILYHRSEIDAADLEKLGTDWYYQITGGLFEWQPEVRAERLYNLILRPFEESIDQLNNPTIVFVHDGILRNLPMAALFDGEKFLTQKWASLNSLGLKFAPESPVTSDSLELIEGDLKEQKLVAFGLGLEVAGWSPLDNVETEIAQITELIGGEKFINRQFTQKRFAKELEEDNTIVHLATHGYFGGVAENSYLLTYDGLMSAIQIERAMSARIDLLVMSACETAITSDRSVLGLAGLALRNNVKSVLGTYWQVQDAVQSRIMVDFYAYLEAGFNVAEALQKVQSEQIAMGGSITDWASLNLIGNL